MKTRSQKQVWDNIAPEWSEFKTSPAQHVIEFLKGKKGKILDLGSGSGRNLAGIPGGKMYLVDFSDKMIELAKKKAKEEKIDAEFVVSSMEKLPFEDNFFDYAISVAAFHCVEGEKNREKAVNELFRVLKKGGEAEICVWNKNTKWFRNSPKERLVKWRDKGTRYYYLFEPEEIYKLAEKAGFKIVSKEEPQRNIIFVVKKETVGVPCPD
jgi:ubiquinone/menaquinone biosynthesis C-methylase UbiE